MASPVHLGFGRSGSTQALYYTSYGNGGEVRRVGLASGGGSPATLSVSPTSVAPGGSVTATWASIASPTANDWIGLFTPGAANSAFVAWRYTTGAGAGNVPLAIPANLAAGTYELRLFSNDSFTRLATSNSVQVT